MPSLIHEIAVDRLDRDPSQLHALAERLLGKRACAALHPVNAVLRLANPEEIRPDLLLARGRRGPWDAVEVQRRIDRAKARRWPLLVGMLHDQRRCMGDLWVITASRRTAAWAKRACDARGRRGTRLWMKPIVLWLNPKQVEALLDEDAPSLAFFAAWAMHDRHGPAAVDIVERALSITDRLSKPLRLRQGRDIVNVLNERVVAMLKERIKDAPRYRESPWVKQWREELEAEGEARGEAKGRQEALRAVLQARGLSLSPAERAKVARCSDLPTLDRWITRAVSAMTTREVLDVSVKEATSKRRAPPGTSSRRSPRA